MLDEIMVEKISRVLVDAFNKKNKGKCCELDLGDKKN